MVSAKKCVNGSKVSPETRLPTILFWELRHEIVELGTKQLQLCQLLRLFHELFQSQMRLYLSIPKLLSSWCQSWNSITIENF